MSNLAHLVRDAARRTPDAIAIRQAGPAVSYGELDHLSDRLAAALDERGVGPGARVAVWLPKSSGAVAAMQAALRLGAAYVPIDPLSPASRVRELLRDADVAACVTLRGSAEDVLTGDLAGIPRLLVDDPTSASGWDGLPQEGWSAAAEPAADALAYILYTSGSTGKPKGVCISHGNALAFIDWAADELRADARDRFANHAAFHFDLSVLDLYASFRAGASVYLIPERASLVPQHLVRILRDEQITIWYSVPSALILMMESGGLTEEPGLALRAILFAGEPFPITHLKRLRRAFARHRLLNLYGPTETNVCAFYEVPTSIEDRVAPVPIGGACSGDRIWAAVGSGSEADVGQRGELMVDGPTVMLGYWGQDPHRGPYATGDVVERVDDATYTYVGRRDLMLKVRGHRIEPAEVEAVLGAHPDIIEAAVTVAGSGPEAKLIGVVRSREGAGLSLLDVKRHCAAALPREMLIDRLQMVDAIPRTRNGKLDRAALDGLIGAGY